MSFRVKVIVSALLLVVLTVSPWLWRVSPWWIALVTPVLIGWYIWMVVAYLRWARTLSGRKQVRGRVD